MISISILDPDGLVVRHLISRSRAPRGRRAWVWDGRDDVGEVVSDEAYSFKLDIGSRTAYFPASERQQEISIERAEFDAHRGLISYELPRASRVRITASDGVQGGISRVIVDWQPRTAGSILEPWNGFDESGQINILSSRESRISIEARALSKNPLIALGNRRLNFQDRKAKRAGESLLTK
ncbi:MAG: hypothetical protein ABI682_08760 [Acidobacteriota bacterium]